MTHVVLQRMVALLALIAIAFPSVGYVQPADNRAALVIKFDDGQVKTACVTFPTNEITGFELLQRSGIDHIAQSYGMGAAVCKIEGVGCDYPNEPCFCKSPPDYWALYGMTSTGWVASGAGASTTKIRNGDIQGWSWGSGSMQPEAMPPAVDFASICPIPTVRPTSTTQPGATPRPSSTPRPSATTAPATAEPVATSGPTRIPPAPAPRPPVTRTPFPPTATTRPTRAPIAPTATTRPRPSATPEPVVPTTVPPTETVAPVATRPNPTATRPVRPTATTGVVQPTATTPVFPSATPVVVAPTVIPQPQSAPTEAPLPPTEAPLPPTDMPLPPTDVPLPPVDEPPPTVTPEAAFDFSQQATPEIIGAATLVPEASVVVSVVAAETVAPPMDEPTATIIVTEEPTREVVIATTTPSPSPVLVAGGDDPPSPVAEESRSIPLDPLVFIGVCAILAVIIFKLRRRQALND